MSFNCLLQWNIRGLKSNAESLKEIWHEYDPGVTCLQETMLSSFNYNVGLNYKFYGSEPTFAIDNRAKGGAAIVVKSSISHNPVPLNTDLQAVAVKVVLGKQYTICSLYLDPGSDPSYEDLCGLIRQLDPPFVVVGDLNAHSMLWDSTRTNSKGLLVERLLEDHDISLLNDDRPTYFSVQNNSTSVIDLGLCSSNIFTDFTWETLPYIRTFFTTVYLA